MKKKEIIFCICIICTLWVLAFPAGNQCNTIIKRQDRIQQNINSDNLVTIYNEMELDDMIYSGYKDDNGVNGIAIFSKEGNGYELSGNIDCSNRRFMHEFIATGENHFDLFWAVGDNLQSVYITYYYGDLIEQYTYDISNNDMYAIEVKQSDYEFQYYYTDQTGAIFLF